MQEPRHLAPVARPRDTERDEDGDAIVTSRAVDFREFTDEARCVPCLRLQRKCHVTEAAESCIQCSVTATAHDCFFIRKVVRQERLNWFSWPELTGYHNNSYKNANNHIQHHREGSHHPYQEPPRQLQYGSQPYPPPQHQPETNHVERAWNQYPPQSQQGPYQQPGPLYNGQMPPPKRQRTDMYDGQDVFNPAHARQHSLPGPTSQEWQQSPRRPEYHLPEIRPHEPVGPPRNHEDPNRKEERPISAHHDRNAKALDLKPPSAPASSLKRKLEIEVEPPILPHRCSKCEASFKTPAELKKHFARHEPQYFCNIPGCSRGRDGFTTKNDLDRHRKTMHKILSPNDRFWKCFYPDCAKTEKVWPRLDNFKAHIVRMHGAQYVTENVTRAEEWWDSQKTPTAMLGRSPETTHDLVAIEPKPPHEPSRLGVSNLLAEPYSEHVNGRRRYLSAEGRQEAAQVREMGACLRCALLKEKCDDNKFCHRCHSYALKHNNGILICRRGNLADFLVPLIPLFDRLPQPGEQTRGWNLRSSSPKLRFVTFSGLLTKVEFPQILRKHDIRSNSFTTQLFGAMDEIIQSLEHSRAQYNPEQQAEIEALRQFREVCCLIADCWIDVLEKDQSNARKAEVDEKLRRTNLELREWYDELDNAVFDWKSRTLELSDPLKKWNLFFAICSMLVMERLTVLLCRTYAYVREGIDDRSEDEAVDTLCALLEFKFVRQAPSQHQFIGMLHEDRHESTQELRQSMNFLRETKGFETWKWLYEQFGDAGTDPVPISPRPKSSASSSEDSDTIQVNTADATDESRKNLGDIPNLPSHRGGSTNHVEKSTNGERPEEEEEEGVNGTGVNGHGREMTMKRNESLSPRT